MTTPHTPSDNTAIRAADDSKTLIAHAALDRAVAWLKRDPSWPAVECVQQRAMAVFLDRVRVLESGQDKPAVATVEADDGGPPYLSATDIANYRKAANAAKANPAPIMPDRGERRPVPVVPRYPREVDYR